MTGLTQIAIETDTRTEAEEVRDYLQETLLEADDAKPKFEETEDGWSINLVVDHRHFLKTFGAVIESAEHDLPNFIRDKAEEWEEDDE